MKNETERKEYYRAFSDELYLAIRKDYGSIKEFAEQKGMARTILITTMTNNLSPYLLRLSEFLRINKDIKYTDISKKIPIELIRDLTDAIISHKDSTSENGSSRVSTFFVKNLQWPGSWWTSIIGGIRITPTARLMELCDMLLEKEIFKYLLIKK